MRFCPHIAGWRWVYDDDGAKLYPNECNINFIFIPRGAPRPRVVQWLPGMVSVQLPKWNYCSLPTRLRPLFFRNRLKHFWLHKEGKSHFYVVWCWTWRGPERDTERKTERKNVRIWNLILVRNQQVAFEWMLRCGRVFDMYNMYRRRRCRRGLSTTRHCEKDGHWVCTGNGLCTGLDSTNFTFHELDATF